jgi:hypothetical protein
VFRDAAGDVFVIWKTGSGAHTSCPYVLCVCHQGRWLAPTGLFPGDGNDRGTADVSGIVDADGRFKVVRIPGQGNYQVYEVQGDGRTNAVVSLKQEHSVEIPPGAMGKRAMWPVSAVLPGPGGQGYLISGAFSEEHSDPLLLFLPKIPGVCTKWWWGRVRDAKGTEPQPMFERAWFYAKPSMPRAGRQLIATGHAAVHGVAAWDTRPHGTSAEYVLVHCWLEGDRWETEEVYRGAPEDGVCDEPLIASGGDTLAIGGSFSPGQRTNRRIIVWVRRQGAWHLGLMLEGASLQDFGADGAGRLYILYWQEGMKLLVGAPQAWSKPIELKGVGVARMEVEDDGVVHVAAESPSRGPFVEGYYLRLEPPSPTREAEMTEPVRP